MTSKVWLFIDLVMLGIYLRVIPKYTGWALYGLHFGAVSVMISLIYAIREVI